MNGTGVKLHAEYHVSTGAAVALVVALELEGENLSVKLCSTFTVQQKEYQIYHRVRMCFTAMYSICINMESVVLPPQRLRARKNTEDIYKFMCSFSQHERFKSNTKTKHRKIFPPCCGLMSYLDLCDFYKDLTFTGAGGLFTLPQITCSSHIAAVKNEKMTRSISKLL